MAFRLAQKPTFKARVDVSTPNMKGGFDDSKFIAEFKRVETDELKELTKLTPVELLQKVLVGFEDLLDENDGQVLYSEETRQALLAIPNAVIGLRDAFWSAINKAKEKN